MTQRERRMATIVFGIVGVGALVFGVYAFYLAPLSERNDAILTAQQEISSRQVKLHQAMRDRARLDGYRALSLPPNVALARRSYQEYLSDLTRQAGFAPGSVLVNSKEPNLANAIFSRVKRTPAFTPLSFTVTGHGSLTNLTRFLERFYQTGLLQGIQHFEVRREETPSTPGTGTAIRIATPAGGRGFGGRGGFGGRAAFGGRGGFGGGSSENPVNISLTIDALVVTGAAPRGRLLPNIDSRLLLVDAVAGLQHAPAGLALAAWAASPAGPRGPRDLAPQKRDYVALAKRDPFYGPPAPPQRNRDEIDVTRYVYLTSITTEGPVPEAYIFNRIDDRRQRLRNRPGYRDFYANDSQGDTRVRGQVVAFKERDLLFQSNGSYYLFHIGDSLHEALSHRLSKDEVNAFLGKSPETRKPTVASSSVLP